ncbi:MAG: MBG domain-containing protein [Luteolibacter sp.]
MRGTATGLTVSASDDGGEGNLSYTWAVTDGPAFPVFFSANASNAAKNTTISFESTGDYRLGVSIRDGQGLTVTDSVNIWVVQTATGIITSPAAVTLAVGSSQPFNASLLDQFSYPMASQPSSFIWTAAGGGTVSSLGNFTASEVGGPFPVTAASSGLSNTTPEGIAHSLTYDGSTQAPVETGTYAILATITDPNYSGTASGSLVISLGNTLIAWKSIHFTEEERLAGLSANDRDPDLDGLPNLAEYALGTSPHDFTLAPNVIRTPDGLSITFRRPADLPDVTYGAESSEDLLKWDPVPLEIISTGSTEIIKLLDPLTKGNPNVRFLRLRFNPK